MYIKSRQSLLELLTGPMQIFQKNEDRDIAIKSLIDHILLSSETNDNVINEPFTIVELNKAIDMSKCTTPGIDEISNDIIKHFSIKTRDYLLTIFNLIMVFRLMSN